MSFALLLKGQKAWARSRGLELAGVCVSSSNDNLFRPLYPESETYRELDAGAGKELGGQDGRRPKILSVRSSSVLALNVFDYWRGRDLKPLIWALDVEGSFETLSFERKAPHGLPTEAPHLDVALTPVLPATLLGIECKFAEPYDISRDKDKPTAVKEKYFGRMPGRWEVLGLPKCQELAEQLGHDIKYCRLNAGQLLKHILGLAYSASIEHRSGPARLIYLWCDLGTSGARDHCKEVEDFTRRIDPAIEFRPLTLQTLLPRLADVADAAYSEYLLERYVKPYRGSLQLSQDGDA